MVSSNENFSLVRLRLKPTQKLDCIFVLAMRAEITTMDESVSVWQRSAMLTMSV
jgi:hypothetical protein